MLSKKNIKLSFVTSSLILSFATALSFSSEGLAKNDVNSELLELAQDATSVDMAKSMADQKMEDWSRQFAAHLKLSSVEAPKITDLDTI